MTTITIADYVPDDTVEEIKALLDDVSQRDVSWNGAIFEIERGDFTCIEGDESAEAVKLLQKIDYIITGY